jgi:hypothetical protein
MSDIPEWLIKRPELGLTKSDLSAFETFYSDAVARGDGGTITYTYHQPVWKFLSYIGENYPLLFHGTGKPDIDEFVPRQSNDSQEFGNQRAVYAASDPLWATYFAVVNRDGPVRSLVNTCIRFVSDEVDPDPHYFFSINEDAFDADTWRSGTLYLLPRDGFEQQGNGRAGGYETELQQWRSFDPVKPLAKMMIRPEDFPFLEHVRGHDVGKVSVRARKNPKEFPWLD